MKQARQELAQQKALAERVLKVDVEPVLLRARIGELEDELEAVAKVRDAWCREYVKVRDALAAARELIEALRVDLVEARSA